MKGINPTVATHQFSYPRSMFKELYNKLQATFKLCCKTLWTHFVYNHTLRVYYRVALSHHICQRHTTVISRIHAKISKPITLKHSHQNTIHITHHPLLREEQVFEKQTSAHVMNQSSQSKRICTRISRAFLSLWPWKWTFK